MTRRRPRSFPFFAGVGLLVAATAATTWSACSIYDASLLLPAPTSTDGASSVDTGLPSSDANGDAPSTPDGGTCAHVSPPSRPSSSSSAAGDGGAIFALASLDFSEVPDSGVPYGYDLDDTCTCPGPDSCVNSASTSPHCDELGGRDNSAGALLNTIIATGDRKSVVRERV